MPDTAIPYCPAPAQTSDRIMVQSESHILFLQMTLNA
jgi:hypothetical protein